jgi:mannose-1-phosphate guanylyltransferase
VSFPTQAMVLAAGRGTRLKELGRRTPKVLLDVGGEPLLARHLRYLHRQGVERVVVNTSHLAEQVGAFAESHRGPPELRVVTEQEPLGTAGGVINALELFSDEPLLVLYGDVITSEDLAPLAALHDRERPVATLAVWDSDDARQKGVVELSESLVTGFREKDQTVLSGWVNAGIYEVEPSWLADFPAGSELDFGYDLFPAALNRGDELRAHRLSDPVLDIGTPEALAMARRLG